MFLGRENWFSAGLTLEKRSYFVKIDTTSRISVKFGTATSPAVMPMDDGLVELTQWT
jgi:hypothetical protein